MNGTTGQFLQPFLGGWVPWLYTNSYWWTAFGFLGNALFGSRFILQWLKSEKERRLVVPTYFWHLSFWGSLINLVYAFHIDNAPIIMGVLALPIIYGRNLVLLYRNGGEQHVAEPRERRAEQLETV
jgi:lipid-A-disaccharide synthase-like uncharacterized protein